MKKFLMFIIILFVSISCGRRGNIEPYEKDNYPKQYPTQSIKTT